MPSVELSSKQLRQLFIDYFSSRKHAAIPSASLIPENDPTVLFTTAGMHPLVPYLMGERHPSGNRLVNIQKCIRTGDIDEVGDSTHQTFFEMLGNWSLGDYFKSDSIVWSYDFITNPDYLGIDPDRIAVTIFAGDDDAPEDKESYELWLSLGIPIERIAKLPKSGNWWGPAGETGPCGPDTEIFAWNGEGVAPRDYDPEDDRWVEVWNNVFMEYNKTAEGKFEPLLQKNVDTGMGLERTLAIVNGLSDNYQTDVMWPIIVRIESITGLKYADNIRDFRIVADHIRAAIMAMADGVMPSNKGNGYVVRRLVRRSLAILYLLIGNRYNRELGKLYHTVQEIYADVYPNITDEKILSGLEAEESKYFKLLTNGIRIIENCSSIDDDKFFDLYQSYGLYPEITLELMQRMGHELTDEAKTNYLHAFRRNQQSHQEQSRTASVGMFKGGLADAQVETTRLHTAAHLMLAAMRKVLGQHVEQKGSNITAERLRFDFSHTEKLTQDQIGQIETIVNEVIEQAIPINVEEMTVDEALASGAVGTFAHKYGHQVKVYTIGSYSKEICGGPHVENTSELGHFKITKEESAGAGIRRVKAILE